MADTALIRAVVRIVTDCLCLVIVCLPTIIVIYDKSIVPFHRGFYCDDETINKPYKSSTVRWRYTIAVSVILPTVTIAIVELCHYLYNPARAILPKFALGPVKVHFYLWTLYRFLGLYYFTLAICMSFVQIGKVTVGRLRPHFLTVCQPDWSRVNCSTYVEGDVCTGDPAKILEARQSFPSGHSSLGFFAMVFTAMYIQCRVTWTSSTILRHALQAVLLWTCWYTALSRISDYKHHWSDVLAGSIFGTVAAFIAVVCVCDRFTPPGSDMFQDKRPSLDTRLDISRKISSGSGTHRPSRKVSRTSGTGHVQDGHGSHGSTELAERERGQVV